MRLSIVLAVIIVGAFCVSFIQSVFGEHSAVVFGLLGLWGVMLFFKHVMNT